MKRRTLFVMLATLATLILPTSAAQADNGDGNEACNNFEICLWRGASATQYRRHYFNNATYTSTHQWWDATNNAVSGLPVKDNTTSVTNRDSSCAVKMIDVKFGTDGAERVPNDDTRHTLSSELNDRADKHERCT